MRPVVTAELPGRPNEWLCICAVGDALVVALSRRRDEVCSARIRYPIAEVTVLGALELYWPRTWHDPYSDEFAPSETDQEYVEPVRHERMPVKLCRFVAMEMTQDETTRRNYFRDFGNAPFWSEFLSLVHEHHHAWRRLAERVG